MRKYLIYRTLDKIDRNIKKHELIAVEYGKDIYDVTAKIIKAFQINALELPEYNGHEIDVFAPEDLDHLKRKTRYAYHADAVIGNLNLPKNLILPYGIVEMTETEPAKVME